MVFFHSDKSRSCCPQHVGDGFFEDCLFLNIFRPVGLNSKSSLPVMLFIHGGAFVGGCGSQQLFYGDFYANSSKVILVTINYRLGAFGFLCNGDQIVVLRIFDA